MKTLTISVAAYNAEKTIEKCLDSMVNAKCVDDLEIIVVNDGSKDSTLEIANRYAAKYPASVIVVDKENGGHGSTINASIVRATGKYYRIVDSDDWVDTDNLEKLIDVLKNAEEDLIYNPYIEVNYSTGAQIPYTAYKTPRNNYSFEMNNKDLKLFFAMHMHTSTVKTDLVKRFGPVIEENCFYVDQEFIVYSFSAAKTMRVFDYPVYYYLLGDANQSVSIGNMIKRRNQHRRVTEKLLGFYEDLAKTSAPVQTYVRKYIAFSVSQMYKIYFLMPVEESLPEFKNLANTVPEELYKTLSFKWRIMMAVIRLFDYKFYNLIVTILQKTGIAEKIFG